MTKCEYYGCPHWDPAPIVPEDYSGYCNLCNDAADNAEEYCGVQFKEQREECKYD